jgi:hypothetical protein
MLCCAVLLWEYTGYWVQIDSAVNWVVMRSYGLK